MLRAIIPKDLLFIAKHVHTWPEGNESVRLDGDGEICFSDCDSFDRYPDGGGKHSLREPHPEFIPHDGSRYVGMEYTYKQWLDVRKCVAPEQFQAMDDKAALDRIEELLRAEEWNADTLDAIAQEVRASGRLA